MKKAIELIVKERQQQIRKGYTSQSDDLYTDGVLAAAAAAYMLPPEFDNEGHEDFTREDVWPWWPDSFKRIKVPYPSTREISAFLKQFYKREVEIVDQQFTIPMSDIQEICIENKTNPQAALSKILYKQSLKTTPALG